MPKKIDWVDIPKEVVDKAATESAYVFISDIDKTYLATQIDSISGLLRAAFETAERKANVPGFSILLRAVRRGAAEAPQKNPLYFVSASPPQIRKRIMSKMDIDGVETDGIIFKNELQHVRSGTFKKLKEQIGYKLGALLSLRRILNDKSQLVLFGDDSESDAVVFSLLSEVLVGNLRGRDLYRILRHLGVFREEALQVSWFCRDMKVYPHPVKAAFVNLETGSQPAYYSRFGPFIVPSENSLQMAMCLWDMGLIRERAVVSVGKDLVLRYDYSPAELAASLARGSQRALYTPAALDALWPALFSQGILPELVKREQSAGDFTKLEENRWNFSPPKLSIKELMRRYSEEGRY